MPSGTDHHSYRLHAKLLDPWQPRRCVGGEVVWLARVVRHYIGTVGGPGKLSVDLRAYGARIDLPDIVQDAAADPDTARVFCTGEDMAWLAAAVNVYLRDVHGPAMQANPARGRAGIVRELERAGVDEPARFLAALADRT